MLLRLTVPGAESPGPAIALTAPQAERKLDSMPAGNMDNRSIQEPTSPQGRPIEIRPIGRDELDRIPLRCWSDAAAIERLFQRQETIGFAAWDGDVCVGQLHCYRFELPECRVDDVHEAYNRVPECWPLTCPLAAAPRALAGLAGPVWGHSCYHVGLTRGADPVEGVEDARYQGRRIGTALCAASIRWAKEHDYSAVVAQAAPPQQFRYALFFGILPWTTYQALGFAAESFQDEGRRCLAWVMQADGCAPDDVKAEIEAARAAGRPETDLIGRMMILRIGS